MNNKKIKSDITCISKIQCIKDKCCWEYPHGQYTGFSNGQEYTIHSIDMNESCWRIVDNRGIIQELTNNDVISYFISKLNKEE